MNNEFSRLLTLLRKEKQISQKKAAGELGISQALLSHYEKGIRKPGLEFLVRCADYYDVSCDYLLGRSPEPTGATLRVEDLPEAVTPTRGNQGIGSMLTQLNNKLISNSLAILFDLLAKTGHKTLTSEVSSYLMLSIYQMFRTIYQINPKNSAAMFSVPQNAYNAYGDAAMQIIKTHAQAIATGNPLENTPKIKITDQLTITTDMLSQEYPAYCSSLLNLIQTAESRISFKQRLQAKEQK